MNSRANLLLNPEDTVSVLNTSTNSNANDLPYILFVIKIK